MERRVLGSKRTSERIQELLADLTQGGGMEEVLKLGMRKLIEEALETEVQDALGRGYYERGEEAVGYRNGQRRGRLKTAEGELDYTVPQVRGMEFRSRVRPELPKRTEALEDLAVEMYARGLSTRDIEATFCDERGRSLLSRTAVSADGAAVGGVHGVRHAGSLRVGGAVPVREEDLPRAHKEWAQKGNWIARHGKWYFVLDVKGVIRHVHCDEGRSTAEFRKDNGRRSGPNRKEGKPERSGKQNR